MTKFRNGRRGVLGRGAVAAVLAVLASVAGCSAGPPSAAFEPGGASPGAPARSAGPTTGLSGNATPSPAPARYTFPVAGNTSYARTHHDYPASDIMAPCGAQMRAVTDGVILEVNRVDRYNPAINDGATRGGLFVSLLGDDGVRYYGSHLRSVEVGLSAGVRVRSGQKLGVIGETGDASACHLHFGISPLCAKVGDWWIRRGEIWPWSYLDSWRKGGALAPVAAVSTWSKAHGCPGAPPAGQ